MNINVTTCLVFGFKVNPDDFAHVAGFKIDEPPEGLEVFIEWAPRRGFESMVRLATYWYLSRWVKELGRLSDDGTAIASVGDRNDDGFELAGIDSELEDVMWSLGWSDPYAQATAGWFVTTELDAS